MALYLPVDPFQVRVVCKDVYVEMNCIIEQYPLPAMLDRIIGSNGKVYRFNIYVDADGLRKGLSENEIATHLAQPHSKSRIFGDVLLVPLKKKTNYTLVDYESMRDGVFLKEDKSNADLVARNACGFDATFRYSSAQRKAEMRVQSQAAQPPVRASFRRLRATAKGGRGYKVKELRALVKQGGYHQQGNKEELVEFLLGVCVDEDSTEESLDGQKLQISVQNPHSKRGYTMEELKTACRQRGYLISGKKQELATRLL